MGHGPKAEPSAWHRFQTWSTVRLRMKCEQHRHSVVEYVRLCEMVRGCEQGQPQALRAQIAFTCWHRKHRMILLLCPVVHNVAVPMALNCGRSRFGSRTPKQSVRRLSLLPSRHRCHCHLCDSRQGMSTRRLRISPQDPIRPRLREDNVARMCTWSTTQARHLYLTSVKVGAYHVRVPFWASNMGALSALLPMYLGRGQIKRWLWSQRLFVDFGAVPLCGSAVPAGDRAHSTRPKSSYV